MSWLRATDPTGPPDSRPEDGRADVDGGEATAQGGEHEVATQAELAARAEVATDDRGDTDDDPATAAATTGGDATSAEEPDTAAAADGGAADEGGGDPKGAATGSGATGDLPAWAAQLPRRAGSAVARGVKTLFATGGEAFRDLAVTHAGATAGDTLVTIALAGTLFFSVPTAEARGNVALYLLLTVAPFAVIGPVLGALLDRYPTAYRLSLILSAGIRALLASLMLFATGSLWLFPLAFVLLVLSRAHGISRNALLPVVLDEPVALVSANARLARVGVLAGAVIAPVGVLAVRIGGSATALALSILAYIVATLVGRRLPAPAFEEVARVTDASAGVLPRRLDHDADAGLTERVAAILHRLHPRHLPRAVRLAQLATAAVRLLNGFLVLLLAFALREADAGLADFGALLAAAGAGFALSSVVSPYLEERLREQPMVVAALALEAAAAFIAGQWYGLAAAAALSATAGFAWGTAKFAFDGLLQSSVAATARGIAFTRSETLFQVAWVLGAVVPTAMPLPPRVGLVIAGLSALGAQVVYVAHLLVPPSDR